MTTAPSLTRRLGGEAARGLGPSTSSSSPRRAHRGGAVVADEVAPSPLRVKERPERRHVVGHGARREEPQPRDEPSRARRGPRAPLPATPITRRRAGAGGAAPRRPAAPRRRRRSAPSRARGGRRRAGAARGARGPGAMRLDVVAVARVQVALDDARAHEVGGQRGGGDAGGAEREQRLEGERRRLEEEALVVVEGAAPRGAVRVDALRAPRRHARGGPPRRGSGRRRRGARRAVGGRAWTSTACEIAGLVVLVDPRVDRARPPPAATPRKRRDERGPARAVGQAPRRKRRAARRWGDEREAGARRRCARDEHRVRQDAIREQARGEVDGRLRPPSRRGRAPVSCAASTSASRPAGVARLREVVEACPRRSSGDGPAPEGARRGEAGRAGAPRGGRGRASSGA